MKNVISLEEYLKELADEENFEEEMLYSSNLQIKNDDEYKGFSVRINSVKDLYALFYTIYCSFKDTEDYQRLIMFSSDSEYNIICGCNVLPLLNKLNIKSVKMCMINNYMSNTGKEVPHANEIYLSVNTNFLTKIGDYIVNDLVNNDTVIHINVDEYKDTAEECIVDRVFYHFNISSDDFNKLKWKSKDKYLNEYDLQYGYNEYDTYEHEIFGLNDINSLRNNIKLFSFLENCSVYIHIDGMERYNYYKEIVELIKDYPDLVYKFMFYDESDVIGCEYSDMDFSRKGFQYLYKYLKSINRKVLAGFCCSDDKTPYLDVFVMSKEDL